MPRRSFRAYYEQLSEFHRGLINEQKEGGWANRRIARHMGRSDAAIRRCWQERMDNDRFQRHDGSGRPRTAADQEDGLIVRSAVTALDSSLSTINCWNHADWRRTGFSDEFRFHLCPDDHRRRVWTRPWQCADPAFPIARQTGPQQEVIVWGAISFEARPLWSSLEAHL
ncbi:HTH_Tnp_Tc3_2 domain-containing protein [Trichonephila clavipes]|nr:HTH_Tnp_Tc3_2 domain-containing protein [Trichonephila clavipes]